MKRLILIDSHAIIHRAYHALPPFTSPKGEPTGAVYGFTSILLRILRELKPDFIAAAFDLPGPTFRHIAYERYKAQRPETPSDLSSQFEKVREILEAFGILIFEKQGYEADDIIGTIAEKVKKNKDIETIIVTGDLDALQLVRPKLKVYSMKKGISDTIIYDEKAVKERYGLKPEELIDFKGLRGDPSDNIAGVKGIGEKTAASLIKEFGSIDGIYSAIKGGKAKKISASVLEKLISGEEDARISLELSRIKIDVPFKFSLRELKILSQKSRFEFLRQIFFKFGFTSLLKRLGQETGGEGSFPPKSKKNSQFEQGSLLANESSPKELFVEKEEKFLKFFSEPKQKSAGLIIHENEFFMIKPDGRVFRIAKSLFHRASLKIFFSEDYKFFVYDAKTIIHFLLGFGADLNKIEFDIMLASYLTSVSTRDFSYISVASRELGRMVSQDPKDEFSHFFEVVKSLEAKLAAGNLKFIFSRVEMPLVKILADMEDRGILLDVSFLKRLGKKIDEDIAILTKGIHKLAGEEFNISSSQQLSKILFEKLKIKTHGLRRTEKGGVISTRESELEKLKEAHPIIGKILAFRELAKLKNTYVDVLPNLVDKKTGRLHTSFNQVAASTGRLSSQNPNLQNIPVMSEYGKEVRKAFVARGGFILASFDYSQIELRVAAHIADDKKMIEAFRKGLDIHKMTASEIYNVPLDKVTPDLRRAAKTLNFGVLYGMGPQALSEATDMSREEAKKFIDEYFHDFEGIRDYILKTKKFAEEQGFVETIFGRRRYIPEINSPNWQIKREAERMAVNMPVQGSATGDIIKMAMIKVDEWIQNEKLAEDVRLLLQVHDELVFEIKKDLVSPEQSPARGEARSKERRGVAYEIKKIMEGAASLKVPLVVDAKIGLNWGEQKIFE